jgi:hypothetical protein
MRSSDRDSGDVIQRMEEMCLIEVDTVASKVDGIICAQSGGTGSAIDTRFWRRHSGMTNGSMGNRRPMKIAAQAVIVMASRPREMHLSKVALSPSMISRLDKM